MFKRRDSLTFLQTIKQFFWPSMGLLRTVYYFKHRVLRVDDSTHKIALGLAIGLGVSFTPLLGTHFIQAGILAYLFRGNIFSAVMGTFVGNPWTFPFFWWSGFSFGSFLFSILGLDGAAELPDGLALSGLWEIITSHPMTLFLPWMLGGYVLAALSIPTTYFVYYRLVDMAKIARKKALIRRRKARISAREAAKKNT